MHELLHFPLTAIKTFNENEYAVFKVCRCCLFRKQAIFFSNLYRYEDSSEYLLITDLIISIFKLIKLAQILL